MHHITSLYGLESPPPLISVDNAWTFVFWKRTNYCPFYSAEKFSAILTLLKIIWIGCYITHHQPTYSWHLQHITTTVNKPVRILDFSYRDKLDLRVLKQGSLLTRNYFNVFIPLWYLNHKIGYYPTVIVSENVLTDVSISCFWSYKGMSWLRTSSNTKKDMKSEL